ncbi:hypothetical protein Ancab_033104 [Ancistrocladus abbreviatus]
MKLSFSLPSKSSGKPVPKSSSNGFSVVDEDSAIAEHTTNVHSYVTEFDASKPQTTESQKRPLIIPPKENEWRPHRKMKNLDLPPMRSSAGGNELRFEVDTSAAGEDPGSHISYGLNLRQSAAMDVDAGGLDSGTREPVEIVLLKKLKDDLNRLPDDEGFEQFAEVPVEGFGAALLSGYGWKEGRGIGRNAKEDAKVVEYKRRTAKEGIGFLSDRSANGDSNNGNADDDTSKRGEKQVMKLDNLGLGVGKEVRIVSGRDVGMKGRILEVLPDGNWLLLKLSRNEEEVRVKAGNVAELGSAEEEKCLKKLKESKIQASKDDVGTRADKKGKDGSNDMSVREGKEVKIRREGRKRDGKHERGRWEEGNKSRVSWLRSHIRVRIISKEIKGGRLYLKKGEVVDVVGPTTCDISMDDGRELIQGVDQDFLETALPRRGGPVLVLSGRHKGVYGSLVERDLEREMGVVQDADTRELLNVQLDQIAEYVGDPSYIGY